MTTPEVIIVGAGVVGSAIGFALGKQGRRVLVLERDLSEPDRIVGELMQPAGMQRLRDLGLGACTDGIDSPVVKGYAVYTKETGAIPLKYPSDGSGSQQTGQSFHHGRFITKLRDSLKTLDTVELRQGTVRELIEENNRVVGVVYGVHRQDGADEKGKMEYMEARAPLTIVCDGCFSGLRKNFTVDKPQATSSFVGVILKDIILPYPNHGHVFLTKAGPVLAYQIGTHETRMLVDVSHPMPSATDGSLERFLLEVTKQELPTTIQGAFHEAVTTTRPRSMANNRLHPHSIIKPGVFTMGDAFNMRHPLTGGGMTVGLSDAVLVRDLLAKVPHFSDHETVLHQLNQFPEKRKTYAATINILAGALYQVFTASNDPLLPVMRQACMSYFQLGGVFAAGPVALLAGLNSKPLTLLVHFFSVAIFGVLRNLWPFPTPRKIYQSYKLLAAASNIVCPLMRGERVLPFIPFMCRLLLLWKPQLPPPTRKSEQSET